MTITHYVFLAVLMFISFGAGVFVEKRFADEEIKMLRTRKVRPANINIQRRYYINEYTIADKKHLAIDFPNSEKRKDTFSVLNDNDMI